MLASIRQDQERREGGFTLIELLVVIIIIGILAAVAIPVFLNQRQKGYDAAAKSDVRQIATAQETYLTENNEYADTYATLSGALSITTSPNTSGHATEGTDAESFTVSVTSASEKVFCWDSAATDPDEQGVYDCTPAAP